MKYSTALLIGEKSLKGETNTTIREKVGFEERLISKILSGNPAVKLAHIDKVADALGFEMEVEFKPKAATANS